jgi:Glycosyl hydrolase catalytic core
VPSSQPLVPAPPASRMTTIATRQAPREMATTPATTAAASQARKLPLATPGPDRSRVCVGVPVGELADYDWGAGAPGLYVNWHVVPDPPDAGGVRFGQMVWIFGDAIVPELSEIQTAATRNPGSLWLIGNEPDVVAHDNVTPEQYAKSYGIAYRAIKEADPSAQVAIAGVAQPTPLRMAYLDRVLAAYRQQYGSEMPVDVWNVHAYILREQRDSWGVGIPPGMEADQGQLYEIKDHADMAIFRRQITDFRRWMAAHGQRDKPLIVSEYGILMPEGYGFPPEAVGRFLVDTFDYFLQARDKEIGYPDDDNRLVQTFCWFGAAVREYPTSNLFDPDTRAITPVGKVFRDYVSALK